MQNLWKLTMTLQVSYENVKFAASDVIRETLWMTSLAANFTLSDVIRETLCQRLLLVEYFEL